MYQNRLALYSELEKEFEGKVLLYVTSDRNNMGAQIASDVIDLFINHLERIGIQDTISLVLYTRGGDTAAAWNIVNLLRMYCDKLRVIVPHKAHSAGTIISLGADDIIMTKQATLSPIDPSIHTPLNPKSQDGRTNVPVSVEAVKGYLEFAKEELGIKDDKALAEVFIKLTDYVHPLVLGQAYRSKSQIQMLAKKLLKNQVDDPAKVNKIVDFLCSESGSHDYTINRREAKCDLGLNIVNPNDKQYELIKALYDDINDELQFNVPFSFDKINGAYAARRGLIESIVGGSDYFVSEGNCIHGVDQTGKKVIQNKISFEGWRHEDNLSGMHIMIEEGREEDATYEECDDFIL